MVCEMAEAWNELIEGWPFGEKWQREEAGRNYRRAKRRREIDRRAKHSSGHARRAPFRECRRDRARSLGIQFRGNGNPRGKNHAVPPPRVGGSAGKLCIRNDTRQSHFRPVDSHPSWSGLLIPPTVHLASDRSNGHPACPKARRRRRPRNPDLDHRTTISTRHRQFFWTLSSDRQQLASV